ncbi:stage II sporulation protein M [bacterium]|nr:stage II sporulation protein M [bacterium]
MSSQAQLPRDRRTQEWDKLRAILHRASGPTGVRALNNDELTELPSLYRRALSDLSLMRTKNAQPQMLQDLSQLCNQAHAVIYRSTAKRRGPGLGYFIAVGLPETVRRQAKYIYAAAVVMVLFAAIAYLNCLISPPVAEDVLNTFGPNMLREWEAALKSADQLEQLRLAAQIDTEMRGFSAVAITFNNIRVGVMAFVLGIAGGVPTLLLLALNGYLLGAVAYLYTATPTGVEVNLPLYFVAGIAPHGSIELPAICLAGAAGMLLGFSWLFPGQRSRGQALRDAAGDAGRLVAACALTLIVAGLIEGFITPLNAPTAIPLAAWHWGKIVFGACVFGLWLLWLVTGGRDPRTTAQRA